VAHRLIEVGFDLLFACDSDAPFEERLVEAPATRRHQVVEVIRPEQSVAAADPGADCDASGVHDFFDFLCFQSAFAAGCS
jgi:hypothetical protein